MLDKQGVPFRHKIPLGDRELWKSLILATIVNINNREASVKIIPDFI